MTDDMSGSIERQLGIMIGQLQGVMRRLDHADDSRSKLHSRIDDMAESVARIAGKVDQVEIAVEEMKPEVEMVRGIKGKALGAVLVLGSIGAVLTWALSFLGPEVRKAIVWVFSSN